MQHLRHTIISKHGDVIDIVELAVTFAVEGCPDIGDENLWTLHDAYVSAFELRTVIEADEVMGQEIDKHTRAMAGSLDEFRHAALETLPLLDWFISSRASTTYLIQHGSSLPKTSYSLFQKWNLFFGRRTKYVCKLFV